MRRFVILFITRGPFMGTGHLLVTARDADHACELFVKAFPVCAVSGCFEMK